LVSGTKKILTLLVFRSNTLNILKPLISPSWGCCATVNKTNLAAQYIYIYIYPRSNKNQKTSKNKTAMIVSQVASKPIRNMNETEDSNSNRNKICKIDETTPKYVGNIQQEMKTIERKRISKVDAKHTRLRRVQSESGT
jgi:hypothetical protein